METLKPGTPGREGKCPREDTCLAVLAAKDDAAAAALAERIWREKYEAMAPLSNDLYLAARRLLALDAAAAPAVRSAARVRLETAVRAVADFAKKNKTNNQ